MNISYLEHDHNMPLSSTSHLGKLKGKFVLVDACNTATKLGGIYAQG